jgi:hypothetical protein
MAVTDPQDTLAYHLTRPLSRARDMGKTPLAYVVQSVKKFMSVDTEPSTVPEAEALWFYAMNHGMAEVRKVRAPYEPLGSYQTFVEDYYRILSPKAVRAFYYLLLICTREARHLHIKPGLEQKVVAKFGQVGWDWAATGAGEQEIQKRLFATPPNMTLGAYVDTLCFLFYNGSWGGGYGGKAWGAVTDCLCRFVKGEFTAEMMLDTVWTLAHNNGPIFNKGQMYGMYSSNLLKILDVQASGQMAEFILHDTIGKQYAPAELAQQALWASQTFGNVGAYVDWYVVEALGSKQKYMTEKMGQTKAHGLSDLASKADKMAAQHVLQAAAAAQAATKAEAAAWFEVMPGMKLKKITRQALAA